MSHSSIWMVVCVVGLFGFLGGCGINSDFTAEQQDKDAEVKMAWLDRAITIAERHNLAYRIDLDSTGRPSIGETIDLYLDTGLSAKITMFGNAARQGEPAWQGPPDEDEVTDTE